VTATLPTQTPPGARTAPRLDWLDALRGYAALVVVLFHLSPTVIGADAHMAVFRVIDLGKYGVLLFFLVSGYVIPMSLERHGDLRRFWIGRLFRIYPAYLFAIAFLIACTASIPAVLRTETVSSVLGHATMLSDPLGLRGALRPFWTLSYEMVFYLVVSGLFAWRLHRHSALAATLLAGTALLAGPHLPDGLLSAGFHSRRITAAVLLAAVTGCLLAYLTGRCRRLAGAVGIAFVLLIAVNAHPAPGSTVASSQQGLLLLAVMFAGTVVYRAQHGSLSHVPTAIALTTVALAAGHAAVSWATAAAVTATFAAAYALRSRTVPRTLVRLGTVSYSLYVLHVVVLIVAGRLVPHLADRPAGIRIAVAAAVLTAAVALAALSYRLVELPAQALGRRLAAATRTQRAAPRTAREQNGRRSV
jgi:peptidoglycan/LPS O-acetylase OafA/YrhL